MAISCDWDHQIASNLCLQSGSLFTLNGKAGATDLNKRFSDNCWKKQKIYTLLIAY